MASIIEGYSYDVFISYRQKDNKHDGWVTDFVDNLKGELESAFKEEITVYFDVNPHDGLLGTHDVNASLEEKLRCLIFIPIISRTYCDPKSFAWEHEFKAFLESARHDRFGLKVKLTGGNVASRILPVQIHDLDPDDRQTLEKELGGLMRGIEFIYKEPGVNRPLRANEDTPHENLNHTTYRNQINKVANSIKELITAIKGFEPSNNSGSPADPAKAKTIEPVEKPRLKPKRRTSKILALAAVVIFAGIIMIFGGRLFRKGNLERDNNGKLSIAVVNFQNNTNDTTLNWLENGIPELLRSNLASGNSELSIQNSQVMDEISESMSQEGKTGFSSSFSRDIARKLKASAYITGSYQKYGDNLLTLARLIDTNTDEVLWAGKTLGDFRTINTLTDSLSVQLKNFLELKALIRMTGPEYGQTLTSSPEACRAYIRGRQYLVNQEWENGLRQFLTALEIDSNFVMASFFVANAYDAMAAFNNEVGIEIKLRKLSAEWIKKTYKNKEKLPEDYRLLKCGMLIMLQKTLRMLSDSVI